MLEKAGGKDISSKENTFGEPRFMNYPTKITAEQISILNYTTVQEG